MVKLVVNGNEQTRKAFLPAVESNCIGVLLIIVNEVNDNIFFKMKYTSSQVYRPRPC